MKNKKYNSTRFQNAIRATIILAAILALCTFIQWGIASSWGSVNIKNIKFIGNSGAQQSGIMFVPQNVNVDNPAPAIINIHGRNCSAYSMISWGIEEARRGYIVLNIDTTGTAGTEVDEQNDYHNISVSAYEYLSGLSMVTEISATGHSQGNQVLSQGIVGNPDIEPNLKCIAGVGGAFWYGFGIPGYDRPTATNYMMIDGNKDYHDYFTFVKDGQDFEDVLLAHFGELTGYSDKLENGKIYGDLSTGTAYMFKINGATHQSQMYDADTIASILEWIDLSSPAPMRMDSHDMVFQGFRMVSMICCVLFICLIAAFTNMLAASPLFYEAVHTDIVRKEGKKPVEWVIQVLMDIGIALLLFVPVTSFISQKMPTNIWTSTFVNQVFFWLCSSALIGLIIFTVRNVRFRIF